jgi:hypothetical protein
MATNVWEEDGRSYQIMKCMYSMQCQGFVSELHMFVTNFKARTLEGVQGDGLILHSQRSSSSSKNRHSREKKMTREEDALSIDM